MTGVSSLLRKLLVGRSDGIRARLRRRIWDRVRPRTEEPSSRGSNSKVSATTPSPSVPVAAAGAPAGFAAVLDRKALGPGEVTEVVVGGAAVALCNVGGTFFAVANACPHAGGPIGDGTLKEHTVTCPYHGWSFDVRDGKCFVNADVHLPTFEVRVVGDTVCVRL